MESFVGKTPKNLFSPENIPYTPALEVYNAKEFNWFGSDLEKTYQKNPHPLFGAKEITYKLNSYGYRCLEFEMRHEIAEKAVQVMTIASSDAFGTGLPEAKTYPAVFKELLQNYLGVPVINWNLSMAGGSADYITRTLISGLQILKPDIVLLCFPPGSSRREYINDIGRLFHCMPTHLVGWTDNKSWEGKDILKAHKELLSNYNNPLNLFKNYKVCEALCEQFKVMWLFSTFDVSIFEPMKHLIHADKLVSPGLAPLMKKYEQDPNIGLARDWLHPGIGPSKDHAEAYFGHFQQLYSSSIEKLKQRK
jgi:hypothetical protein